MPVLEAPVEKILDSINKPIKFDCPDNCYVAYGRVSTREQAVAGAGLPAQRTALKREVDYKELLVPDENWLFDAGFSGKDINRPQFTRAFEIIAAGRARGIVVSKLDRMTRSLLDFAVIMNRASKGGFNVIAIDVGLDLSTPMGEMMAGVIAVFAQFERRLIGQRTKDGLAEKRAQGIQLGRPVTLPTKTMTIIVAARTEGQTFRYIAELLNNKKIPTAQGGKQWYASTVKNAYDRWVRAIGEADLS